MEIFFMFIKFILLKGDFAFLLPFGDIVSLPARPDCEGRGKTSSILVGSFLIVVARANHCVRQKWDVSKRRPPLGLRVFFFFFFCFFFNCFLCQKKNNISPPEPTKCCRSIQYIDLQHIDYGWKT
jgi:hypothetical protein